MHEPAKPPLVLVVRDRPGERVPSAIRDAGFSVLVARDATAAVTIARATMPAAIVVASEEDGSEVRRRLAADETTAAIPLVCPGIAVEGEPPIAGRLHAVLCGTTSSEPPTPSVNGGTRPRRVLLVDDHDDSRELFAELLGGYGYEIATAADGLEALERLRSGHFDVAVVDIGLPGVDGYEVARRTTETLGERKPYLVAMTGYGSSTDRELTRLAGFDIHLVKPVEAALLIRALGTTVVKSDG